MMVIARRKKMGSGHFLIRERIQTADKFKVEGFKPEQRLLRPVVAKAKMIL